MLGELTALPMQTPSWILGALLLREVRGGKERMEGKERRGEREGRERKGEGRERREGGEGKEGRRRTSCYYKLFRP